MDSQSEEEVVKAAILTKIKELKTEKLSLKELDEVLEECEKKLRE